MSYTPLPLPDSHRNRPAGDRQTWGRLPGASLALAAVQVAAASEQPLLLVSDSMASAYRLEQELKFFAAGSLPIQLLPDWETLPYDTFSPHQDIISERLRTLSQLPNMQRGILVVPVTTLMQRLLPADYLLSHSLEFTIGQTLNIEQLRRQLSKAGYNSVATVYEHGEYALRGSLLDIYPMGSEQPIRIDLFDDEIDSLRYFDAETQRTLEKVEAITLLPGKEYPLDEGGIAQFREHWHEQFDVDPRECPVYQDVRDGLAPAGVEYYLPLFFSHTSSLFDYLPEQCTVLSLAGIEAAAEHFWQDARNRYEQRQGDVTRPILAPLQLFLPVDELFAAIKQHPRINLHGDHCPEAGGVHNFDLRLAPELSMDAKAEDPVAKLRAHLPGRRVLLCAESAGRRETLLQLLRDNQLSAQEIDGWPAMAELDVGLYITVAGIDQGLELDGLSLVTESQLFGQQVRQSRRRKKTQASAEIAIRNLAELRSGAAVVHADHGVGRYLGLERLNIGDQDAEFLCLQYAEEAKLYVPVNSLHLISHYGGADESLAPLHRLGSEQWSKAKRKAAEKIRDVAAELLAIYAEREARTGKSCAVEALDYQRFAADFPFEETPDQEAAIKAVVDDMRSDQPMDRLVCGDVGFGKTEVAMRAAFIAVQNNLQVSVLVPTTLLAQQHYESFKDRFADWPVRIETLSRFKSAAEQKAIIAATAEGKVDILVGTHKLLSDELRYKNLGLVIIDEEHRFGVRQKEALKSLRAEVDVLNLTATPIPRTLNMSMSGMRDLSIIATPPARRLSVKTFVREHDEALIKEAILREIVRGGQVYYLHNEVKTIDKAARDLAEMLPEIRVGVGHGQMRESELEQVMSDFYHKRHNVLVCSTIIETGIDVPNANTIIISRADKFGLAQLHQLRGRVGRSHHQAYAYLLTPPPKQMTNDAHKRLDAISEAADLGAGFMLATHDMEIRGAGELLGEEQSGQIQSIGFSLYMEMLERAVEAIKSGKHADLEKPLATHSDINLHLPALIPDDYLPDVQGRLVLYKRIASAKNAEELRELQVEMIDRFGLLPEASKNLFRLARLQQRGDALGVRKIEASDRGGRIEFNDEPNIDPLALVKLVQSDPACYRLDGATALKFSCDISDYEERFEMIETLLDALTPQQEAA